MRQALDAEPMILVDFTASIRLVSEANIHEHWATTAKRVKEQRRWIYVHARKHMPVPLPCIVTMTRIAPRELDDDNAVRSCKAIRDELALLMGIDDRDPRVHWRVRQAKGSAKQYGVRVQIELMLADLPEMRGP